MAPRLSAAEARRILDAAVVSPTVVRARRPVTVLAADPADPAKLADLADPDARGGELEIRGAMHACWFTLPFPVRSKSNFRRFRSSDRDAWREVQRFEEATRAIGARFRPVGWELGPPPPAPVADRPQVLCFLWARTLLDAGNVSKSVLDALEGVFFHSDASVAAEQAVVTRASTDQRGLVALAQLPPSASAAGVIAAQALLAQAACVAGGGEGPTGEL